MAMTESNTNAPLEANGFSKPLTNGDIRESIEEEALTRQPDEIKPSLSNGVTRYGHQHMDGSLPSPGVDYDSNDASAIEPASSAIDSEEQRIQAYAKLEFVDGDFYMTTHVVELGRDTRASPRPSLNGWDDNGRKSNNQSTESVPESSNVEEGGVRSSKNGSQMNGEGDAESDVDGGPSTANSSQQNILRTPTRGGRKDYNALAHTPPRDPDPQANDMNMDDFDLSHPIDCPLIPLRQPRRSEGRSINKKSISRRHARIAFNFDKHYFELLFLGRNGGFLDDEWFATGDIQPLVNGSLIQIGGLGIRFVLPYVRQGRTGASEVENEMRLQESDDEESAEDDEAEEEDDDQQEEEEDEEVASPDQDVEETKMITRGRGRVKAKPEPEPKPAKAKRKKPGRPPKNGVMSKREQAEAAKQAKLDAKTKKQKKSSTASGRGKGKTAKALELEESSIQPSGKRKYKKRKRAGEDKEERQARRESSEQTESVPPEQSPATKPSKEKKAPKPPRSPSPVWDESTLTAEQLAKPQSSYVILIHEALTSSQTGAMSLPQIYRAIERRYPYFKLRVTTQGWQSSVRHNLGQHAAFRKIERDGKGWMWGYNPEVPIEKEKRRRVSPPPQTATQQRYYPQQQMQAPRPSSFPYPGMTYPGTHNHQYPPNNASPVNGYNVPTATQPGQFPPRTPFAPPRFPMILDAKSDSAYKSPYDPSSTSTSTQQTPQTTSQSQSIPSNPLQPNSTTQPQPNQTHYSNTNPFPQPQPQHPAPNNNPPWPPSSSNPPPNNTPKAISQHTHLALQRYKTTLLADMTTTPNASSIIDSAINRALGTVPPPDVTPSLTDEDLTQVTAITAAAHKMLQDIASRGAGNTAEVSNGAEGNSRSNGGTAATEEGKAVGGGRPAEVAEQVVRSMPPAPVLGGEGGGEAEAEVERRDGMKRGREEMEGEELPPEKRIMMG